MVSLLPSATEILCALGLRSELVAVSHECDYPTDVAALPRITSSHLREGLSAKAIDRAVVDAVLKGEALYRVDGDLLADLNPDLIVTQGVCDVCAVNQDTVAESLKFVTDVVPQDVQILSLSGRSVAGVWRDIQQVAEAVGVRSTGQAVVEELRDRWHALVAQPAPNPQPRVMMLEWPDPPFYGGHWVPEQVHAAGGVSVLGSEGQDSKRCTWDEIAAADPDVIFVMACGYDLEQNIDHAEALGQNSEASRVRAVRTGNVWACDANSYFSRPAPRLVDGARIIQQVLHGETPPADRALRVMTGVARV
ncbi:MAG: cobalamin-binding protein [Pseudomonadota bacterium]